MLSNMYPTNGGPTRSEVELGSALRFGKQYIKLISRLHIYLKAKRTLSHQLNDARTCPSPQNQVKTVGDACVRDHPFKKLAF